MNYTQPTTQKKSQVNFENIPQQLKALPHWCLWNYEHRNGEPKPTKVPLDARRVAENCWPIWECRAESDNRSTWATFDEARETYERFRASVDGIGFFLQKEIIPLVAFDFDEVGDEIPEEINRDIRRLNTYAERSPSGTPDLKQPLVLYITSKVITGIGATRSCQARGV